MSILGIFSYIVNHNIVYILIHVFYVFHVIYVFLCFMSFHIDKNVRRTTKSQAILYALETPSIESRDTENMWYILWILNVLATFYRITL